MRAEHDCTCADSPPPHSASPVVVLVHGTFARHAEWVRTTSTLADAVREAGGTPVTFCWSGRNRHRDRLHAGGALRELLLELVADVPRRHVRVIAHSHGGNVALYAVRAPADVPDELAEVEVTTLATPFIHVRPRRLSDSLRRTLLIGEAYLCLVGLVTVVAPIAGWLDEASLGTWLVVLFGVLALVIGPLRLVSAWLFHRGSADDTTLWDLARDPARAGPTRLTAGLPDRDRLTPVRSVGDEAGAALGVSQLLTSIAAATVRRVRVERASFVVGLVAVAGLVATWLVSETEAVAVREITDLVVGLLSFSVAAVPAVLVMALYSTALPFGIDGIFLTPAATMTAESTPVGTVPLVQLEPTPHGLVHAIYDHPTVLRTIQAQLTDHH